MRIAVSPRLSRNRIAGASRVSRLQAGALRSTARDLALYAQALTGRTPTPPAGPLRTALRLVLCPPPDPAVPLAWNRRVRQGRTLYFHSGSTRGHQAFIGFSPETVSGVAALTSHGCTLRNSFIQDTYMLLRHCAGIT